jgi:hypothetical protein
MKRSVATREVSFLQLAWIAIGLLLMSCLTIYAQTEPANEDPDETSARESEAIPGTSVDRSEPAREETPVLSVDQVEPTLFQTDEPVLFTDPSVPMPEQSLMEDRTGVTEETVLEESQMPETKPSDVEEVQQIKKWALQLRTRVGMAYDDNIFISNTNRVADTLLTVTGGISLIYGDWRSRTENFLAADYEGGGVFYFENPDENSFTQIASLAGQYRIQRLTTRLRSQYIYLTGAERDIGDLATRHLFNNSLQFTYDLSGKTSLFAGGFADIATYETFFNSYEFGAKISAEYQILQKVRIGPEFVIGFLDVEDSPFQIYEQIRARAIYEATGKLDFEGSAGVEFRQFNSENRTHFVFSLAGNYRPFPGTAITLRGYRRLFGSAALQGEDFIATGIELAISQRFFQRLYLTVATGYENDEYIEIAEDVSTDRVDNYVYVRPAIAYAFTKWISISGFYEFRNNFSNESEFAFYNNRVGGAIAFQF